MPAWAAAAAAVTMASAPAVVLLIVEESRAQGQVTERIIMHTALSAAASFVVFAVVVGVVHAEYSDDWLNAVVHPLWVVVGALIIAWLMAGLALLGRVPVAEALAGTGLHPRGHGLARRGHRPHAGGAGFSDALPDGGDPVVQRS
jgi:ABC-type Co2+ transport system permease subunit